MSGPIRLDSPQERIAALRAGGWSLEDVARATGVNWWTVYRWSRGETGPQPANLERLFALPLARPSGEFTVSVTLAL